MIQGSPQNDISVCLVTLDRKKQSAGAFIDAQKPLWLRSEERRLYLVRNWQHTDDHPRVGRNLVILLSRSEKEM